MDSGVSVYQAAYHAHTQWLQLSLTERESAHPDKANGPVTTHWSPSIFYDVLVFIAAVPSWLWRGEMARTW